MKLSIAELELLYDACSIATTEMYNKLHAANRNASEIEDKQFDDLDNLSIKLDKEIEQLKTIPIVTVSLVKD